MINLKMVSTVKMVMFLTLVLLGGVSHAQSNTNDTAILNLKSSKVGMHKISYDELLNNHGVDLAGLRHNRFALLSGGELVSVFTKGSDRRPARFGSGGYISFYAEASDSLYSAERVFTLVYDQALRRQSNIGNERAKPRTRVLSVSEYTHTQKVEEDRYYDYVSPSKTDPWHYGQLFSFQTNGKTVANFDVDNLVGSKADLSVNVYGIVDIISDINDHHFVAKMNGVEVGDQQFDGNVQSTLNVSQVDINEGANEFDMSLRSIEGNPFDAIGLNKIVLTYQRSALANNDQLEGRFVGAQAKVTGVVGAGSVYRKTGNRLTKLKKTQLNNSELEFKINGGQGEYIVVNEYHTPAVAPIPEYLDISSGSAEYLVITHESFQGPHLESLVQMRSVDYSVKVVDVSQIYAQYGHHVPSAEAIHDYIKFAAANLDTRFVTFVGSDTYDYKQIKSNSVSFVPTMYAETPGGLLFIRQTPSDASYGDLDADGVPDIPVGRISVRTQTELATVVEKIRDYQAREGYAGVILLAADKDDVGNGISFADDVDAMIDVIPSQFKGSVRGDYKAIPDVDGDQEARDKILNAINAGVSVTAYIGHSSQNQWSRANPALFKASDIAGLTNVDKPTLVTQWGCWNTYFVDPSGNSMADQFLVSGDHGAVTVLGASTLTTSEGERTLGIELNKVMYLQGKTIGEAVIEAKQALAVTDPDASDILLGWQIIGDPALVIYP